MVAGEVKMVGASGHVAANGIAMPSWWRLTRTQSSRSSRQQMKLLSTSRRHLRHPRSCHLERMLLPSKRQRLPMYTHPQFPTQCDRPIRTLFKTKMLTASPYSQVLPSQIVDGGSRAWEAAQRRNHRRFVGGRRASRRRRQRRGKAEERARRVVFEMARAI